MRGRYFYQPIRAVQCSCPLLSLPSLKFRRIESQILLWRLEVTMDDVFAVQIFHAECNITRPIVNSLHLNWTATSESTVELAHWHVLHDNAHFTLHLAEAAEKNKKNHLSK